MGRRALSLAAILLWLGAGVAFALLGIRSIRLEREGSIESARKLAQTTVEIEATRLPADVMEALNPVAGVVFVLGESDADRHEPPTPPISADDRLVLDQAAYVERAGDPAAAASLLGRLTSGTRTDAARAVACLRAGALAITRGRRAEAQALLGVAFGADKAWRDPDGVPIAPAAARLLAPMQSGPALAATIEALLDAAKEGVALRGDGGIDASDLLRAVAAELVPAPSRGLPSALSARLDRAVARARLGRRVVDALGTRKAGVVGDQIAYRSPEVAWLSVTPIAAVEAVLRRRTGVELTLSTKPPPPGVPSTKAYAPLDSLHLAYPTWATSFGAPTGAGVALAIGLCLYLLGGLFAILWFVRQTRASRMQADFVAAVSHEMKTPIAGIQAMAEMLADGRVADPARAHAYAERIRAEASRLGAGVRNVLDAARIERDPSSVVRPRPTEPSALVLDLASVMRPVLEARGFRFTGNATPSPRPISIDPDAFGSVVGNLLDNAAKFSTETKEIEVDAGPVAHGYRVSVLDRGPGVPEAERARIFERFERGEHARRMAVPGVGLGLHVAKNLVNAHRGTIEVRAREGGGAVFVVEWPEGAA